MRDLNAPARIDPLDGSPDRLHLARRGVLLHDAWPPPVDEEVTRPILDDDGHAGRTDLLDASGVLLEHELFEEWALPVERILALAEETQPPADVEPTDAELDTYIAATLDADTRQRFGAPDHNPHVAPRAGLPPV